MPVQPPVGIDGQLWPAMASHGWHVQLSMVVGSAYIAVRALL